jgi:hypothetical protein
MTRSATACSKLLLSPDDADDTVIDLDPIDDRLDAMASASKAAPDWSVT